MSGALWAAALALGCVRSFVVDGEAQDSAGPDDSGLSAASVCLPGEVSGYAMPGGRWALSSLFASRRLDDLDDSALSLPPEWFLASAWQSSGFGCADFGAPWAVNAEAERAGCLGLEEGTHWTELTRLYPQLFPADAREALTAGDQIEASVAALTWHTYAAYALLQRYELDPDAWLRAAGDPLAVEKLAAITHAGGAWSWQLEATLSACGEALEACLEGDTLRHVEGVVDKLGRLEGAPCYDEALRGEDVERFLSGLEALWPDEDWATAREATIEALDGGGFSTEGPAVLTALEGVVPQRLVCPEQELWAWYRYSCP